MKKTFTLIVLLGISLIGAKAQSITNTVTVDWDAVTQYSDDTPISDAVKYDVYRATLADLSDAVKLNGSELTGLSLTDNSLERNKIYYYYVRAFVIAGLESQSNTGQVRTYVPKAAVLRVKIE